MSRIIVLQKRVALSFVFSLCMLLAVGLSGCSGGTSQTTSGQRHGDADMQMTDRESCLRSCNASYAACADSDSARRDVMDSTINIGAQAGCDASLRSCLKTCGR